MWTWIHRYAKPETTYNLCTTLFPWLISLAILSLGVGLFWGLFVAPPDYQQGDAFRIIFVHVPGALLSLAIYSAMTCAAITALVWQYKLAYMAICALAPIGATATCIALITGAIWGKPMWGTWWVWDARLTSELILLFIYLGIIQLQQAFKDKTQGGKAAAVMTLVGVVNLPVIHYSVEWWNTLHQGATISKWGAPSIHPMMHYPLLICLAGFALFSLAIFCLSFQNEILRREHQRPWVLTILREKTTHVF